MADTYNEEVIIIGDDTYDVHEVRQSDKEPEPEIDENIIKEQSRRVQIMRNAWQKLDGLPLSFGLPPYSDNISDDIVRNKFDIDLKDAMRIMKIVSVLDIEEDSYDEMMLENRVMYYAIKRFRRTASAFFKFSTAIDGKTVDKTKIAPMLKDILDELDEEYKKGRVTGSTWHIEHNNLTGR